MNNYFHFSAIDIMDIFQSVILGLIEGLTEFLPISSTGHLIVVSHWLGLEQTESNKAFEVIIQVAAILAVFTSYSEKFRFRYWRLWLKVCIAFLPIAIIGFIFKDIVKALFSVDVVATMFIIGGIIFLLLERHLKDRQPEVDSIELISYKQAAIVGFAQIFALIPGTSRAGSTIVGALMIGLSRRVSAEFSFLLALPVLGATGAYDLLKHYQDFAGAQMLPLIVGFVVAFLTAHFVIKVFIEFLNRFTFNAFGIYRILFGVLLFALA